jgi:hypothetical protein
MEQFVDIRDRIEEYIINNPLTFIFDTIDVQITKVSAFLEFLYTTGQIVEWQVLPEGSECIKIYAKTESALPFIEITVGHRTNEFGKTHMFID